MKVRAVRRGNASSRPMAEGRGGKGRKCKGRDASRGRRIACVEEELRAIQANPAMEAADCGSFGLLSQVLRAYHGLF